MRATVIVFFTMSFLFMALSSRSLCVDAATIQTNSEPAVPEVTLAKRCWDVTSSDRPVAEPSSRHRRGPVSSDVGRKNCRQPAGNLGLV